MPAPLVLLPATFDVGAQEQDPREAHVGVGEVGVDGHRSLEMPEGVVEAAEVSEDGGEIEVGEGVVGGNVDGGGKAVGGVGEAAETLEDHGEVVMGVEIAGGE